MFLSLRQRSRLQRFYSKGKIMSQESYSKLQQVMTAAVTRPSALLHEIQLEPIGDWSLFKFSESLQERLEALLEKKKADRLDAEEASELAAIGELDRIFTHMNAMLAAQYAHRQDD